MYQTAVERLRIEKVLFARFGCLSYNAEVGAFQAARGKCLWIGALLTRREWKRYALE